MSQTVTGSAGSLTLASAVTTTAPVDGEAASAASQVTLVQALANWIAFLKTTIASFWDGTTLTATGNVVSGAVVSAPRFKATGTALVAGDFALGTGWGSTATVFVAAGSNDAAGSITVSCSGAGIAANPRIIMTFKNGSFGSNAPVQIVTHSDNTESGSAGPLYPVIVKPSTTAPQWFLQGTPVTAKDYTFTWITVGK